MSTPLRYQHRRTPRAHRQGSPMIATPPALVHGGGGEPPALYAFQSPHSLGSPQIQTPRPSPSAQPAMSKGKRVQATPPMHPKSPELNSPVAASPLAGESLSPVELHAQREAVLAQRARRAQRAQGRIVTPSKLDTLSPAPAPADAGSRARAAAGPEALADLMAASEIQQKNRHVRNNLSISYADSGKTAVPVRLPSRRVTKHITPELTAEELAKALVKEHRLEFNFEDNTVGEDDDIILWECVDGTRRPLRPKEKVEQVVKLWDARSHSYLRTTSTSLRNDVDSLASLVPRRDMLRAAPEIEASAVHFSRPSVMFNPHDNANGVPYGNSPKSVAREPPAGASLQRVPTKLCPTDRKLSVRRNVDDNDDVALHSRLVWGFGALFLQRGRIEVKQKPGDELVCSFDITDTDVYEWPHNGPKRYVVVLRPQSRASRAVYVCTDSARIFSVLRNAVFTARTKALVRI